MLKRGVASLCAAVAMAVACAGQAEAALVHVTWGGFYASGNGPNGPYFRPDSQSPSLPGHEPVAYDFNLNFVFDTSRGQINTTALGGGAWSQGLTWNAAMGGLSPLVSATLEAFGQTFTFDGSAGFSLDRNPTFGGFSIVDGDRSISGSLFSMAPITPFSEYALDDEFSSIFWDGPCCTQVSVGGFTGQGYTYRVAQEIWQPPQGGGGGGGGFSAALEAVPVPEPETWALMILGFAGIGAALRKARRRGNQLRQTGLI